MMPEESKDEKPEKIRRDEAESPAGSKSLSETVRINDIGKPKLELPVSCLLHSVIEIFEFLKYFHCYRCR